MSEGRDALEQVIASKPYRDWAGAHRVDSTKVAAEMRGVRRPQPGAAYARGLVRLARVHPKGGGAPVSGLWLRDGVFVRRFSNFSGIERQAARDAGFVWMALQLDHSADVEHNIEHMKIGRSEGWTIVGWSTFGQGTDARADGARHAGLVRDHRLSGWVANGEAWAEAGNAGKSAEWWAGWDSAGGSGPVALSCLSSETANFGRAMDWAPWMNRLCMVMPQVYGATFPTYTVGAMLGSFAHTSVPVGLLAPTFDVIEGVGPFTDYAKWKGPRSVWTGDDSRATTWPNFQR
jgi:hypothetical protein